MPGSVIGNTSAFAMNQNKVRFMATLNRTNKESSGSGLEIRHMFYTYVLYDRCRDKFYIGFTKDIKRRLGEHSLGNVHTTARFSTLELIFYECFISREDAVRREKYFKTSKGKKSLKLILRNSLKKSIFAR